MTFQGALKRLDIEDYAERIWNSNSRGELFFIQDYIDMASLQGSVSWFRPLFLVCVKFAENNWTRPESCFQHIPELMVDAAQSFAAVERSKAQEPTKQKTP
jgi:hypothetical protein